MVLWFCGFVVLWFHDMLAWGIEGMGTEQGIGNRGDEDAMGTGMVGDTVVGRKTQEKSTIRQDEKLRASK